MTGVWMFGKETVFQSKFDQNLPFSGADEKISFHERITDSKIS